MRQEGSLNFIRWGRMSTSGRRVNVKRESNNCEKGRIDSWVRGERKRGSFGEIKDRRKKKEGTTLNGEEKKLLH